MTQGRMREVYPSPGEVYVYQVEGQEGQFTVYLDGQEVQLSMESQETEEGWCRTADGRTHAFAWAWVGSELHLWLDGSQFIFQRADSRRRSAVESGEAASDVLAPMPGAVLEVLVGEGDRVDRNQAVVVMESMKMELVITASRSGVVRRVSVQPGDQVDRGMRLLELAAEGEPDE